MVSQPAVVLSSPPCTLREHLTTSGQYCGCHSQEQGELPVHNRWRQRMLPIILQGSGRSPQHKTIWSKMSTVLKLKNSGLGAGYQQYTTLSHQLDQKLKDWKGKTSIYLVTRTAVSCWIPPGWFFECCHWQKFFNVVWALKDMEGPS